MAQLAVVPEVLDARGRHCPAQEAVIVTLTELGGEVTSEDGFATGELADHIGTYSSPTGLSALLRDMERAGIIKREINGKRTYGIALTKAYRRPQKAAEPAPAPAPKVKAKRPPKARPAPLVAVPNEPAPAPEPAPGLDYGALAEALLKKAVAVLAHPPVEYRTVSVQLPVDEEEVRTTIQAAVDAELVSYRTARDEITQAAELAIQEAEQKAATALAQVDQLQAKVKELDEDAGRLKRVLRKYRDAERGSNGHYKLPELADAESRKVLEALIREVPRSAARP